MRDMQLLFFDKNTTRFNKNPVKPYYLRVSIIATIEWE